MSNDESYIKTIAAVRNELGDLLPSDDIRSLETELDKLRDAFPNDDDFVDETLDFLERKFPAVHQAVQIKMGVSIGIERVQSPPGDPDYLPPGTLLVCPVCDCDYEYELRNIGEWPVFCPIDGQKLHSKVEE